MHKLLSVPSPSIDLPFKRGLLAMALAVGWPLCAQAQAGAGESSPAQPQENPAQEKADAKPADNVLQTVVVTANRRSQRAMDVAGSVNAMSGARLEQLGAQSLVEFASFVPGLQVVADRPGYQQQSIRGITTGINQTSATVGTYIDESPVSFNSNFGAGALLSPDPDPIDLARIEVLKGPQGSLYGASALGGLIKYVTVTPSLKLLEARAEVGYEKIADGGAGASARAAIGVPILEDVLGIRVSAFSRKAPGYLDNVRSGADDTNSYRNEGGRVVAYFRPSEAFNARLTVDTQRISFADASTAQADVVTLAQPYGDLKTGWQVPTPSTQKTDRSSLTLNYDLGWANLLSVTSGLRTKQFISFDYTDSYGPFYAAPVGASSLFYSFDYRNRKDTQEFRLTSPSGGERFEWQLGYFYTKERTNGKFVMDAQNGPAGGPFVPVFPGILDLGQNAMLKENALYANGTFKLTERFDVQVGARHSRIQQQFDQTPFQQFGMVVAPATSDTANETSTTWLLSPKYRISANQNVYARVATGYRPGGPNQVNLVPTAPPTFKSDSLINYELGWKGLLPEAKLDFAAAAFRIDWKDMQVLGQNVFTFYANGGKAHTQGLEFEAGWHPVAPLRLGASLAVMNGQLDEDVTVTGVNAKKGDKIPYVPGTSAALNADYATNLGEVGASFGASVRYVGKRNSFYAGQSASPVYPGATPPELPAYELVDFRAAFTKDIWTLTLFMKNAFDKRGILSFNGNSMSPGATGFTPGGIALVQPRTFAFTLRVDY